MTNTVIRSSTPSPCCDAWNTCAVPEKFVVMLAGSVAAATLFTAATAPPRLPPGCRLNDTVTLASCPECATLLGPVLRSKSATSESGTSAPVALVMYSLVSAFSSNCALGTSCMSTQNSFVLV